MSSDFPLVTVVALCYNHEDYVIETLESIRSQTYSNIEVFVVDDFSNDNSVNVLNNWVKKNMPHWNVILHKQNMGICKSLNETLDIARGRYYKVIACDDVLLPQFISCMVENFELLSEHYGLIYSNVRTINEHSQEFGITPFSERGWVDDEKVPSGKLFDLLSGWCFIPAPAAFMLTRVLKEIRFDESLIIEDWDMWLQISKRYLIKGINVTMVMYRIHSASMCQKKSAIYRDHELRTVEKHLGYSEAGNVAIKDFIYRNSLHLYMNNGDRPIYWLYFRFTIRPTISNFFHLVLALAGISFEQKEKWRSKWISS